MLLVFQFESGKKNNGGKACRKKKQGKLQHNLEEYKINDGRNKLDQRKKNERNQSRKTKGSRWKKKKKKTTM